MSMLILIFNLDLYDSIDEITVKAMLLCYYIMQFYNTFLFTNKQIHKSSSFFFFLTKG